MAGLPPEQRQAIEMAFFSELTHHEIAGQLKGAARHGQSAYPARITPAAQRAAENCMIDEAQQDQAALYVLGSLEGEELRAFEAAMAGNSELRALVRDLRDAAGAVALHAPAQLPPGAVKQRIMREIASDADKTMTKETVSRATNWIPGRSPPCFSFSAAYWFTIANNCGARLRKRAIPIR